MVFSSKRFLKYLKGQIDYRYQKALYVGFSKSLMYHFVYGYFRSAIEVLKSISYLLTSIRYFGLLRAESGASLALYNTNNQKNALTSLKKNQSLNFGIYHVGHISILFSTLRLITWCIKLVFYPICFLLAKSKSGAFHSSCVWLMAFYNTALLKLIQKKVTELYISNDHVGDIFILSILARPNDIKVNYVQHGAVKPEFPENYFDTIFVENEYYRGIYSKLARNESVSIIVYRKEPQNGLGSDQNVDVLIVFSHQFYIVPTVRLINKVRKNGLLVAVRFHPSDRFSLLKYRFLRTFCSSLLCSPATQLSVWQDFERSTTQICASSSVLLDAYQENRAKSLVWYKPIGLKWDYYSLEDKLNTVASLEELDLS